MVFGGAGRGTCRAALLRAVTALALACSVLAGCTRAGDGDQGTRVRPAEQARVGDVEEVRAGGHRYAPLEAGHVEREPGDLLPRVPRDPLGSDDFAPQPETARRVRRLTSARPGSAGATV